MNVAEKVYQHTQTLPNNMQVKTLHYVELLNKKINLTRKNKKLSDLKGKVAFADDYDYKIMRAKTL